MNHIILTQMMFPWFGNYGYFPFGGILMLIFWIIVIYLIFRLLRPPYGSEPPHDRYRSQEPDPLDILRQRYARGDIDKSEYEERKKVLTEK